MGSVDINQIPRLMISVSWIYHGLFPKLIWIAPMEKDMTASFGFSEATSYLITKSGGVLEIAFGLTFFFLYKSRWINYVNVVSLSGLLVFVAVKQPHLLVEAFNPVTTNLSLIAFSALLLINLQKEEKVHGRHV